MVKLRHIYGRQQRLVEEVFGVGKTNDIGARADTTELSMTGDDDCLRWIKLLGVLLLRVDVADEVAVDEVR